MQIVVVTPIFSRILPTKLQTRPSSSISVPRLWFQNERRLEERCVGLFIGVLLRMDRVGK